MIQAGDRSRGSTFDKSRIVGNDWPVRLFPGIVLVLGLVAACGGSTSDTPRTAGVESVTTTAVASGSPASDTPAEPEDPGATVPEAATGSTTTSASVSTTEAVATTTTMSSADLVVTPEAGRPELDISSSFACIGAALGQQAAVELNQRPATSGEMLLIDHCPEPTHDMACVNGALGMQVTDQLLAGRYEPTPDELEQVRHCSLSAAPELDSGAEGEAGASLVDIQSAFACVSAALGPGEAWGLGGRMLSAGELDKVAECPMPTHDQNCVEEFVGGQMLGHLVTGRYQATANDASMIQHCELAYGSTWSSWLGSEPFFVDAPSDSDQAFGDTAPDQDWDYPDDDGQGQTDGTSPAESDGDTTASPATLIVGELRSVRGPASGHSASSTSGCSVFENGQCAELRWERVTGLRTGVVGALAISPSEPDVIYAGFDSNDMSLWRSDDAGSTWTHVAESAHVSGVAVKPTDSRTVIHGVVEGDLLFSADGGAGSEVALTLRGMENYRFSAVAYASSDPDIAYTSASGRREGSQGRRGDSAEVYISADSGRTWSLAGVCAGCGFLNAIIVDPADPDLLYAATATGVRRSDDGGATWTDNLLTGLDGYRANVLGLALQSGSTSRLLATTSEDGVYRSDDGGTNWVESSTGLDTAMAHDVVFAVSDADVAYVTTHQGVYRSDDGGRTWDSRSGGLTYEFVHAIAVDPRDADVAYVGTASELHLLHGEHEQQGLHEGEGIYKTLDGGRSWFLSDTDIEESNLTNLTPHPKLPFEMWAGANAGRGGFVTTSGGESWLFSATDAAHYPMVFAYSHSFPTVQYLTSLYSNSEIIRSTDGGHTWPRVGDMLQAGLSQRTLDSGLYDPDMRWKVHAHGLAVAPSDPQIVFAGTIWHSENRENYSLFGAHIFRSADGGDTFQEVDNGFPTDTPTSINAIVIHPTDPDTVYVMTSGYESDRGIGVYKTTDGGDLWFAVNDGLHLETNDLQIDPIDPETLYAATKNGVYKTTDGASSWRLSGNGLLDDMSGTPTSPSPEVFDLAIDPVNPLVLYAAGYLGVYKTNNGGGDWYLVNLGLPIDNRPAESVFDHDRTLEVDASGRVVYAVVGHRERERLDKMVPYRAVLGTPGSFGYTFGVGEATITAESTSHLSELVVDLGLGELRFTAAGPVGTVASTTVTIPMSLLAGPFVVTVDSRTVDSQTQGNSVSFSHDHTGRSQVTIRRM